MERETSRSAMTDRARTTPSSEPIRLTRWATGVRAVGSVASVVAVWLVTVLRLAQNSPLDLPAVAVWYDLFAAAALAVPALTALAIGLTSDDDWERVGLSSVGVFGLFTLVSPAAGVPAAGAITVGGGLAIGSRLGRPHDWFEARRAAVSAILVAGIALSLAGAMGIFPTVARSIGTTVALFGVAMTPVFVSPGKLSWVLGGTVAVAVLQIGSTAPFVTGAVVLVSGAVVNAPLLIIAVAAGGGVVTVAGGMENDHRLPAIGALVLLAAGVPATVPRALAVVLGVSLLVGKTEHSND